MLQIVCVLAMDHSSHLGRLDPASLSQQARMEMFIESTKNKNSTDCFLDTEGKYNDIAYWPCVAMGADSGKIVSFAYSIEHGYLPLHGTLNFSFLPQFMSI